MPIVDRQKEREIVTGGLQRGMSEDQIKAAVTKFREENASQQPEAQKSASALDRLILSFGTGAGRDRYLQEKGISPDNVNKPGLDLGDVTSKAGGLVRSSVGALGTIPGIGLGAIAGAPLGPLGAIGGAIAGGATTGSVGQVQGEALRQAIGGIIGINQGPGEGVQQAKEQFKEGAIGGALTPILSKVGSSALSHRAERPIALIKRALNPTPQEKQAYSKEFAEIVKEGYVGTMKQMQEQAKSKLSQTKPIVEASINKVRKKVVSDGRSVLVKLAELEDEATNAVDKSARKVVSGFFDEFVDTLYKKSSGTGNLTVGTANEMLRAMDRSIGSAFKRAKTVGVDLAPDTEVRMAVANILRDLVNNAIDPVGREAMKSRHTAATLLNLAVKGESKKSVMTTLARLTGPTAGLIGGVAVGNALGNPFTGAAVGSALGTGLATAYTSPLVSSARAQLGRPTAALAGKIVAGSAGPAKDILSNLIIQSLKSNK